MYTFAHSGLLSLRVNVKEKVGKEVGMPCPADAPAVHFPILQACNECVE